MFKLIPYTQTQLKEIFTYNYDNGSLIWNTRSDRLTAWNDRFAGQIAGCQLHSGYIQIRLNTRNYRAHRIIFKLIHNKEPEQIDHIDGNRSNNKIENLRAATPKINVRNSSKRKDNTSGITGVRYIGPHRFKPYEARWYDDGILKAKSFVTLNEAIEHREREIKKRNYTNRHGK
jgi:hypothetical protein